MRAGLNTIQQTLTPEAANVVNQSIAEAGRRNHGQTTPLHVAATLLASPSGYLRQACIRSHPNSSHPLQCRALELCFSVALDRLPSGQNLSNSSSALEPPISNALLAALKRAQAHQRRGCPEQQQQPLLAVKVELEQLVVSILDDPSVSRVMKEASFSSPAVKACIEQALNANGHVANVPGVVGGVPGIGLGGFRNSQGVNRNLYMNPRLQNGSGNANSEQFGQGRREEMSLYRNPRLQGNGSRNENANSDQFGQGKREELNLYMNPRLQNGNGSTNSDQFGQGKREEVNKVVDILLKSTKRNPVLVGESEPELVLRELVMKIQKKELNEGALRNVEVMSLEKEVGSDRNQILMKIKDMGALIDIRMHSNASGAGIIFDLGDLKWLVEQPVGFSDMSSSQQVLSEMGRVAVVEMGKIVKRFDNGNGRLWLIASATCATYVRCQVYHPTMEQDWGLQAIPIAARTPLPGLFPRIGNGTGILSSSVESLTPVKSFPAMNTALSRRPSENLDPARRAKCCPMCTQSYEKELAKLVAEFNNSSETKQEVARQPLPQWLQVVKPKNSNCNGNGNVNATLQLQSKDQEVTIKHKTLELQRKWNDTCLRLHPNFHHNGNSVRTPPGSLSLASLYNSNPLGRQDLQPKLQVTRNLGGTLQMSQSPLLQPPSEHTVTPPRSPVRTDLVLGNPKISESTQRENPKITESTQREQPIRDMIESEPQDRFSGSQREKLASVLDPDSFKSLFKRLYDKVWWQKEAAAAVAANVTQCRSGNSRRQGFGWKGDTWLLFEGPDRVGKKKMAMALSELVSRTSPVIIRFGSGGSGDDDLDVSFRGKTMLDRIAEAVQRNPSSVILLEDIDQADMLVHAGIRRAIERGRLPDSHGREVNLKNVIFILTANSLPENVKDSLKSASDREEKLADLAGRDWHLELSVGTKNLKRRRDSLGDETGATKKLRTETGCGLAIDLNEAAPGEDDTAEGSRNSSDLTAEHDNERGLTNKRSTSPLSKEFLSSIDEAIVFKPVDFGPVQTQVASTIVSKFTDIVNGGRLIEVDSGALEQLVGGVWFGGAELEEWAEKVLVPSFHKLSNALKSTENNSSRNDIVRLISVQDSEQRHGGGWLPTRVTVVDMDAMA